jgi:hypothetical protein
MTDTQNMPYVLATPQHRLGGRAVEFGLYFVTFGIGWFIWNLIVWSDGRTPGHQVLKMRIYSTETAKPASWGHMALRQFVLPFSFWLPSILLIIIGAVLDSNGTQRGAAIAGIGYLIGLIISLVDIFWIFKGSERQRLVDKIAKTAVLNECIQA